MTGGIYAYTNSSGVQVFVNSAGLTDRGSWTVDTTYAAGDAVAYLGAVYVSFTTNTNTPPAGNVSADWSVLVLIETIQEAQNVLVQVTADGAGVPNGTPGDAGVPNGTPGDASDPTNVNVGSAPDAADGESLYSAFTKINRRTAGLDTKTDAAIEVAWAGTSAAAVALQTAWAGTSAGTVYTDAQVAVERTARIAGDAAVGSLAYVALQTAWAGTGTANTALALASTGTNLGYTALTTAWAGTATAAASGSVAYTALQTAWAGTALATTGTHWTRVADGFSTMLAPTRPNDSVSVGDNSVGAGQNLAGGSGHSVEGENNLTGGVANSVSGDSNFVFGIVNNVTGDNNVVIGNGNNVNGNDQFVIYTPSLGPSSIVRTDANSNLSGVVIGSGLTFNGTTLVGVTDQTLAYTALQTAWTGTRTANTALATAWAGTSAGTIYTDTRIAAEQASRIAGDAANSSLAYTALTTAWTGTHAAGIHGTYALGNTVSGGTVTGLGLASAPSCAMLTLQSPVSGINMAATLIGPATSDGFVFGLTGETNTASYVLHYHLFL